MSDLQIGLAIGAVVLALAVLGYNHWQEAKHKKSVERAFGNAGAAHQDVLMSERVEPSIGNANFSANPDDIEEGHRAPLTGTPTMPMALPGVDAPIIHGQIDTVALVLADTPLSIERIWPAIERTRGLSDEIRWEGLVNGVWQPVDDNSDDDAAYRELRVGLQLASRRGPTEPSTIRAFDRLIADFANEVGAVSQREDVAAAEKRALDVDKLCAESDIEIAINIVGKNGATFATTKVRGLAEAGGMMLMEMGEYAKRDDLGHVEFTLRNMNAQEPPGIKQAGAYLTGLTFALDVPRTLAPVGTFERMRTEALKFADTMGGEVVDDNKRPLTANGRKSIAATIAQIQDTMDAREIVPGSAAALRLYA
ncbi:MAG: hypothetical protein JNJ55_12255 [Betaproteobacteria bacterium]|nr:hypothetical protein [Betaproteobacteria bacterium]